MSKPFQIQSTTERLAGWAPMFQKFEDSGLSQRKFCQQEKLNFATFTKWYQLRNQLDKARLAQQGSFIPVQLEIEGSPEVTAAERQMELVVQLPLGVTLRFRGCL